MSGEYWQVGQWLVDPLSGEISGPGGASRLEPKLLELLRLLVEAGGALVTHEQLLQRLWPGMIVGEDTVARSVSRLRRALGDAAKAPSYVQTLPKRGYRLVAPLRRIQADSPPSLTDADPLPGDDDPGSAASPGRRWIWPLGVLTALLVTTLLLWGRDAEPPAAEPAASADAGLLARADDHYAQYQYPDNEAALLLYERVLSLRPEHPPALAGLANALVQKAMRWPDGGEQGRQFQRLGDALASGHLQEAANARLLARARGLAERAVELDPDSVPALRALGLAVSAQGEFATALDAYGRAIELDPQAWGVLINLADVLEITGEPEQALPYFEAAYAAMERAYADQPARIRPWDAALGVLIGDRYRERGDLATAEGWYRRVLRTTPTHPPAILALTEVLRQQGGMAEAERWCASLRELGVADQCTPAESPDRSSPQADQ